MKIASKFKKNKKEELNNSKLKSEIKNFKFIEEIYKIIRQTIKKAINKISTNKIYQKESIEKIKLIKKDLLYFDLIIFLLISTIFRVICQNSIIYKNSIITLKVSHNGYQKIFNTGTRPSEVLIDNKNQTLVWNNSYNLNKTNIVKLIWTNNISYCQSMFQGCDSIIEMHFTNFDATNCNNTDSMFRNCSSLISLDLSGFSTSNFLKTISNMFWDCKSLISLNLSTFDTSKVTNFGHLFCGCESLKWIDISNFKTENVKYMDNMLKECKNLTSVNLSHFNTSNVIFIDSMFSGCESLKIIDFSNLDVTSVTNINLTYVTDNVFLNCTNLKYINIQNLNSNINLNNTFFSGSPKNLIVCNEDDKIELSQIKLADNSNCRFNRCYNLSDYKSKINITQNYENDFSIETLLNDSCMINYIDIKQDSSPIIFDNILKKIEYIFTSKEYDTTEIENGRNDIIKYNHMTVTLTSTKNQKNVENNGNETTINLRDCERVLKEVYNISENETLFIKKIDVLEEGMKIPKVEFEVYHKLNRKNLI